MLHLKLKRKSRKEPRQLRIGGNAVNDGLAFRRQFPLYAADENTSSHAHPSIGTIDFDRIAIYSHVSLFTPQPPMPISFMTHFSRNEILHCENDPRQFEWSPVGGGEVGRPKSPRGSGTFSSDQPNSPIMPEQPSDRSFPPLRRTSDNSPPYFDRVQLPSLG